MGMGMEMEMGPMGMGMGIAGHDLQSELGISVVLIKPHMKSSTSDSGISPGHFNSINWSSPQHCRHVETFQHEIFNLENVVI